MEAKVVDALDRFDQLLGPMESEHTATESIFAAWQQESAAAEQLQKQQIQQQEANQLQQQQKRELEIKQNEDAVARQLELNREAEEEERARIAAQAQVDLLLKKSVSQCCTNTKNHFYIRMFEIWTQALRAKRATRREEEQVQAAEQAAAQVHAKEAMRESMLQVLPASL